MSKYKHLIKEERHTLEKLLELGHTQTNIAKTLGYFGDTVPLISEDIVPLSNCNIR